MKRITIVPGCISCGTCQVICPEVFEVTDISHIKQDANIEKNEEKIKEAIEACPVSAIKMEE